MVVPSVFLPLREKGSEEIFSECGKKIKFLLELPIKSFRGKFASGEGSVHPPFGCDKLC